MKEASDVRLSLHFVGGRDNRFAIEQFDAAIARAGKDSLIAKMAMHNRAILQRADDESYDAFEVFAMMIDSHDAPDELRACSMTRSRARRRDHRERRRRRGRARARLAAALTRCCDGNVPRGPGQDPVWLPYPGFSTLASCRANPLSRRLPRFQ